MLDWQVGFYISEREKFWKWKDFQEQNLLSLLAQRVDIGGGQACSLHGQESTRRGFVRQEGWQTRLS